jgi:hypothetical protein
MCARVGLLDEFTEFRLSGGDRDSLHAISLDQRARCLQAVYGGTVGCKCALCRRPSAFR